MTKRALLGGGAVILALALSGCSSSPKVGELETDGLISACLNSAIPDAQDSNTTIEGPVSAVATEDGNDGTEVHIIFDARDSNGTADPAQCTLTVSGKKVTELDVGSPDSEPGTEVEGAAERWNDKHAEDWADGGGPDPAPAPEPGDSGGSEENPYGS